MGPFFAVEDHQADAASVELSLRTQQVDGNKVWNTLMSVISEVYKVV